MQIYTAATTGSLQLPIFTSDPKVTASGHIWYNSIGDGSVKYAIATGSGVITRTFSAT